MPRPGVLGRYCAATVKIILPLFIIFHFLLDNKGSFLYNNLCCEQQAQLAQLVEQRTENPRVSGSIPELGICGCSSMVEHQPSKLDTWVRFPSPASSKRMYMREWLRGGVQPCQGWGRGFESRLALFLLPKFLHRNFGFLFFQKLFYQRKEFL